MLGRMRTTITLDPDVEALLKRLMIERGVSFKVAVNEALRSALSSSSPADPAYETPTFAMGEFLLDVTHANRIVADLEDEETIRQLQAGR